MLVREAAAPGLSGTRSVMRRSRVASSRIRKRTNRPDCSSVAFSVSARGSLSGSSSHSPARSGGGRSVEPNTSTAHMPVAKISIMITYTAVALVIFVFGMRGRYRIREFDSCVGRSSHQRIIVAMGYELIEKQVIFEGRKARLEVHHLRDEQSGRKLHLEIVVHTGAVCVLPFVDENTVMLIRQKRYAIGQIIVEIP